MKKLYDCCKCGKELDKSELIRLVIKKYETKSQNEYINERLYVTSKSRFFDIKNIDYCKECFDKINL